MFVGEREVRKTGLVSTVLGCHVPGRIIGNTPRAAVCEWVYITLQHPHGSNTIYGLLSNPQENGQQ